MKFIPFREEHVEDLLAQPAQARMSQKITPKIAKMLEGHPSFTAMDGDIPVGAAGIIVGNGHRGMAWAYLTEVPTRKFITIHKGVLQFLEGCYVPRLEMTVDCGFEEGHRWARLLGFTLEAEVMRSWNVVGEDVSLYARIR
ncbi:MAG: hypothetical protein ABGX63_02035 [bacterium]